MYCTFSHGGGGGGTIPKAVENFADCFLHPVEKEVPGLFVGRGRGFALRAPFGKGRWGGCDERWGDRGASTFFFSLLYIFFLRELGRTLKAWTFSPALFFFTFIAAVERLLGSTINGRGGGGGGDWNCLYFFSFLRKLWLAPSGFPFFFMVCFSRRNERSPPVQRTVVVLLSVFFFRFGEGEVVPAPRARHNCFNFFVLERRGEERGTGEEMALAPVVFVFVGEKVERCAPSCHVHTLP